MIYLVGTREATVVYAQANDLRVDEWVWVPNGMSARGRRLNSGDRVVIAHGTLNSSQREAAEILNHELERARVRRDTSTRQAP